MTTRDSSSPDRGGPTPIARTAAPLRQEMIAQLRAAILAFEYEPGTRLKEKALCDRYGVSRTVVREALRHLEAEGIVHLEPNRGPVVATLTREDAVALFEVRARLEELAAELFAVRASAPERARLRSSVNDLGRAFETGDVKDWLGAKAEFYDALFTGTHNHIIPEVVLKLHARAQMLRGLSLQAPGRRPQSLAEIQLATDAAVAGDAAAAGKAMRVHVERAAANTMAQLVSQPALADVESGDGS